MGDWFGGGDEPDQQTVVVQQTATQEQNVSVGAADLNKTIDNLVNVLLEQAKNPDTISPTIIPVTLTQPAQPSTVNVSTTQPAQPSTVSVSAQPGQTYDNAVVAQLLGNMYYQVLKGQQPVENQAQAPVDLKTIFIAAAIIAIAVYHTRRG